ncbi:hypothetical protein BU23DRAFT_548285 [Bimuria novae-zelandiae CBS 107.79]|uniref:Uncharacterized protein n=1 Tax=Bimuria novae-zelandiae CBS 107.79 TaxID=1447943 RepID=A0A6A5VF71_9PLEO|nr:hypothetical protein BU23DRAFT_555428 [Bimuria novae-zelandiae CBS 107.79]KAF1980087.1 hypothetical protein BU23DRAFT_548285 [Bimuria novae-zelandiae CBS 107.79]
MAATMLVVARPTSSRAQVHVLGILAVWPSRMTLNTRSAGSKTDPRCGTTIRSSRVSASIDRSVFKAHRSLAAYLNSTVPQNLPA